MNSFEFNKMAGAILFTLLVYMGVRTLADVLYATTPAEPTAYIIEGVSNETTASDGIEAPSELDIMTLLANADVDKGVKVARKCLSCHSFEATGANRIGPGLWGIVRRDIATRAGFSYSTAFRKLSGTWTPQALSQFLLNPKKYVPGTNMAFVGLRKPTERANIIAYLSSLK